MKNVLIFLILITTICFSQTDIEKKDSRLNKRVNGVVSQSNTYYLVTEDGFLEVQQYNNINQYSDSDQNAQWDTYYKKVYGDSVENPNTIIEPEQVSIWPFLFYRPKRPYGNWGQNRWGFANKVFLYDFIRIGNDGNYEFRPGVNRIIDRLEKIPDVDFPQ